MDLLPQVSSEDLDKRDLQCGDLAMHEDTRQVQLHLKAYIYLTGKRQCHWSQATGSQNVIKKGEKLVFSFPSSMSTNHTHISSVNGWGPPEGESTIGNLVQS